MTELFIKGREVNISLDFITESHFSVSKIIILNTTHYLIMNIRNKQEFQQIAFNHSSDIDFKIFCETLQKMYQRNIFFLHLCFLFTIQCLSFRKDSLEKLVISQI